jgi:hypothetical protein
VVEDAWIWLIERWRGWFGVGDGVVGLDRCDLGLVDTALTRGWIVHGGDGLYGVQGVDWDGELSGGEDGILLREGGFGSALPETGEQEEE